MWDLEKEETKRLGPGTAHETQWEGRESPTRKKSRVSTYHRLRYFTYIRPPGSASCEGRALGSHTRCRPWLRLSVLKDGRFRMDGSKVIQTLVAKMLLIPIPEMQVFKITSWSMGRM